ncbi:hypothetical protein HCU64_00125 [Methylobacterium sp. C25]|nr:hypothetical protein [Methylobacterium sp. C25]
MHRVNVARGAFRIWTVLSVLWLGIISFLAWDAVSYEMIGNYQYAGELREDLGSEPFDSKRPIAEVFKKPSQAKWPASFSKIEFRYQSNFDASVKDGTQIVVDFPDGCVLYLYTAFGKQEQELVGRWFWEKRWKRRWNALARQSYLLWVALVPPLLLFALWFIGRWIVAGFRRA